MGIVALIVLAWGVMVMQCTSVLVHDYDMDFAPAASEICSAYQHGGGVNISRQSAGMEALVGACASFWPLDGIMDTVHTLTGGLLGKKLDGETKALAGADVEVGKLTVLVDNVKKCCADNPKFPQNLQCTLQLHGYKDIAAGYVEAVGGYFKDFASPETWKEGVCKILRLETATKPIQTVADTMVELNKQLQTTCVHVPTQAFEMLNGMTKGLTGSPTVISDGLNAAKDALLKLICGRRRG